MRTITYAAEVALIALALAVPGVACAKDYNKYDFHVENGGLMRGKDNFTIRAIDTPRLIAPETSIDDFARTIARLADVGADSVCFDLFGFDEKGKSLSSEAVEAVNRAQRETKEYRMSAVCRVFGADAPEDPDFRMAAVATAAKALKGQTKVVYWIDGPDCAKLVAEFLKYAPDAAVAAPEGAPMVVVTSEAAAQAASGTCPLLVGAVPADPQGSLSFVAPDVPATFATLDEKMALAVESEPWEPDNSGLSEEERADGWIALFDGKTFNGWVITGSQDGFRVRDGMIEWVKSGGGSVRTRDRYENFVLRFEWKIESGGNSGVYLRAPRAARASRIGMEFQLQGDHGKPVTNKGTGAFYDAQEPRLNAGKPAGEWNTVEIALNGTHARAVLNGQLVQDLDMAGHDKLKLRLQRGFIALQDHNNQVAFRNIRIKPL
ncbi:MAG: DUF1080 domain-containing protein [Candidatus Hydrogenedentes bacterium]|nr:DUF1080 domain-containing protein [Candidatus Hydrogenedentota bacterium]